MEKKLRRKQANENNLIVFWWIWQVLLGSVTILWGTKSGSKDVDKDRICTKER